MGYMSSTGVGTLVPSKRYKSGTKVPTPEKMENGAGVLTPSHVYANGTKVPPPKNYGTKVPAPIFLNNYKKNKLKKVGISDFLIRQLTKVEKDFIEHIEHSVKKLKGKA